MHRIMGLLHYSNQHVTSPMISKMTHDALMTASDLKSSNSSNRNKEEKIPTTVTLKLLDSIYLMMHNTYSINQQVDWFPSARR